MNSSKYHGETLQSSHAAYQGRPTGKTGSQDEIKSFGSSVLEEFGNPSSTRRGSGGKFNPPFAAVLANCVRGWQPH